MGFRTAVSRPSFDRAGRAVPAPAWFAISALFHYLGPSFAVLLFPAVGVLGVTWFRIAAAAFVFAPVTRPLGTLRDADRPTRLRLVSLGFCLAAMNTAFYLALDRLPMSLVAAMEFSGTVLIALWGIRTGRNLAALGLTIAGVLLLIDVRWASDLAGLVFAFLNAAFFVCYIALGHRIAEEGAASGVTRLGAAMAAAFVFIFPFGILQAAQAFAAPHLVLAGIGVGVCSSVIPYISDQFAMARLPRASFALMLALLPATATLIGAVVLGQMPAARDVAGILLVMAGVAVHQPLIERTEPTRDET